MTPRNADPNVWGMLQPCHNGPDTCWPPAPERGRPGRCCRAVLMVIDRDIVAFETDVRLAPLRNGPRMSFRRATYLSSVKPPGRASTIRTGEPVK